MSGCAEGVVSGCADCAREADHCHGTLVRHVGGELECTEPACRPVDPDRHDLVLECADLGRECGCLPAARSSRPA